MNRAAKIFQLIALGLGSVVFAHPSHAQNVQCGSHVSLAEGEIHVSATGADDTENIRCALEEATRLRVPVVSLDRDDYFISHIQIERFEGTLEGGGMEDTLIAVLNDSVDCDGLEDQGQAPAALKFINGNVKIARLSIGADDPCMGVSQRAFNLIHFTGSDAFSGCSSETGFGFVDRSGLISIGDIDEIAGVSAIAEGAFFGTCRDTQLGTFKLNRSLLGGFLSAVNLGLRGSAQVDINFNDFIDSQGHVLTVDASQLLTVQTNTMVMTGDLATDHIAITIGTFNPAGPNQNRAVIFRNIFDLDNDNVFGVALGVLHLGNIPNLSLAVTENDFFLNADEISGPILISDISGANVANNKFKGTGLAAVSLVTDRSAPTDTTITGNSFGVFSSSGADVFLDVSTTRNIVGTGQNATVFDLGIANFVLDDLIGPNRMDDMGSPTTRAELVSRVNERYEHLGNRFARLTGADAETDRWRVKKSSQRHEPATADPETFLLDLYGRLLKGTSR